MKNIQVALLAFSILTLMSFFSCKSTKKVADSEAELSGWKATAKKTEKQVVDFDKISLVGKTYINAPELNLENMSASYKIAILRDSLILIRVSKIIEAYKILIRPDSIFVMDKLQRILTSYDYSLAQKYTGLEADFATIQDLLLGNYAPIPDELSIVDRKSNPMVLKGSKSGADFLYSLDATINKLVKINAKNEGKGQSSEIKYSEFLPFGETLMPQQVGISVLAPKTLSLDLEHKKVLIDPENISFKFVVPASYEKISGK